MRLSNNIFKGDHTIQIQFNLVQQFHQEDLNVILHQNMSNLYNRYKSAIKIHRKTQNMLLLIDMYLQLKFDLILIYIKAAMDN
jgi:hypothetical protein